MTGAVDAVAVPVVLLTASPALKDGDSPARLDMQRIAPMADRAGIAQGGHRLVFAVSPALRSVFRGVSSLADLPVSPGPARQLPGLTSPPQASRPARPAVGACARFHSTGPVVLVMDPLFGLEALT